uniref:Potassium channel domain-containing protein n=1 Tax=Cuerna arida TaxID=1464854 RepID=A0A1B6FNI7_9HEMI
MSFKQYMVLFLLFMGYLVLGAYMFYSVERPVEEERRALAKAEALEIKELLRRHYAKGVPEAHKELLSRLSDYCGKPFYMDSITVIDASNGTVTTTVAPEEPYEEKPYLWTFYNAMLFVICTLSTIGYGNIAPSSRQGRMLDVVYGMIGIPFMGIVLTQMADYFGRLFLRAQHRYKSHEYQSRLSLFFDILTYTGLGFIIFILIPSSFFVYFEDWTFDTGIYYSYVTLCTIGYGDLVAGQRPIETSVYDMYKLGVLMWIMFGLGYMLMLISFLTRVMKSKRVRNIEHKLALTIKSTQSKIWNEFSQDITYLRRMLNEMYLLKIQPVYVEKELEEDKEGVRKVKSCPNLSEWPVLRKVEDSSSEEDEEEMAENFRRIAMRRRKGNAENLMQPRIKKTVSDGDLYRIDRKATFGEDTNTLDPKFLLAKVVDALGTSVGSKFTLDGEEEAPSRKISSKLNGFHGFTDEEILASEKVPSRWSLGGRKRTISETEKRGSIVGNEESRTWGGVNALDIQKFLRMRANGELRKSSQGMGDASLSSSKTSLSETLKQPPSRMRRMSMAVSNLFSHTAKNKSQEPKDILRDSQKKRRTGNIGDLYSNAVNKKRMSLPQDDQTMLDQANYLSHTAGRRGSVFAALASELAPTPGVGPNIAVSPVLEQTSVADFLRLLSSLQAKLDPTLSLPPGNQDAQNMRKSDSNQARESMINPLAMLFSASSLSGVSALAGSQEQRRVSIAKTPQFLEAKGKQGRRFSLMPPMDNEHPSGQLHRKDLLKLKKRSISSNNMLQHSDGSTINIPGLASRERPQRSSLSGTAKYINAKFQNSSDPQKTGPPHVPSSQGFRKFSIRPVSVPEMSPPSLVVSPSVATPVLPTITVESFDSETTKEEDENLQDVIISKL